MKPVSIFFVAASTLFGQSAIQGPVTGWVWDQPSEAVRPVLGIPGASVLGARLESGVTFSKAVSDQRSYLLGIGAEDQQVYLQTFRATGPAQLLKEIPAGAERIALSPSGDSALFYYGASLKVALVTGLPANARLVREIDLAAEGEPSRMAVSDGGSTILLAYPADRSTMVVDAEGNRWKLNHDGAVKSLAFADQSSDALIADDRGVWLVRNVNGSPEERAVMEGGALDANLSATRNRVVAVFANGVVKVAELDSANTVRTIECGCEATTLSRMAGGLVFRLNEPGDQPLWLVDLNGVEPRAVFVPADVRADQ